MTNLKQLPIAIEDFEKLIKRGCYYIDKTGLIKELLKHLAEVNLFTRPRRFGKSLNISMLKCFFELGADKNLFDGLAISKEKELCEKYQGQYPVISLNLKGVESETFEGAKKILWNKISAEWRRHRCLLDSKYLADDEIEMVKKMRGANGELESSIQLLSEFLHMHYGKKVIILIDEYDVPLQKAECLNYYKQMTRVISLLFGNAMKGNPHVEFAVITGCLRVAKESIFTGFNNVSTYSILTNNTMSILGLRTRK